MKKIVLGKDIKLPKGVTTNMVSDGYHTFDELYHQRMLHNALAFNALYKQGIKVLKSKKHHDGELCFGGGWFVVHAELPTGQVTQHYELKDWELFKVPEVEKAPIWDGHSPEEANSRIEKYIKQIQNQ